MNLNMRPQKIRAFSSFQSLAQKKSQILVSTYQRKGETNFLKEVGAKDRRRSGTT